MGLAAPLPQSLWIELTSRCPYDCVFCSRKSERGAGQHMDFALYEALIRQLDRPEVIRLNYSGESLHYPQLAAAIRLARGTGATTEIVSALGTAPLSAVEALVDEGLHRLSVSIHTLQASEFRQIYGRGEFAEIRGRLEHLARYQAQRGATLPVVDFAFVAMETNLPALADVATYAAESGVPHLSIHPVIRRGLAPGSFSRELDADGQLHADFARRLEEAVADVSGRHAGLTIAVARPEEPPPAALRGITTCEQNPWETVHVLADGRVVSCEVQDRTELGDLRRETLAEIWHGPRYQAFRRRYADGGHPGCQGCPWRRTLRAGTPERVLVRGWHPPHGDPVHWATASAALAVDGLAGVAALHLEGILPPPPEGQGANTLSIHSGAGEDVTITNEGRELLPFAVKLAPAGTLCLETRFRYSPAERGTGADIRRLGFGLSAFRLEYSAPRRKQVNQLLAMLAAVENAARLRPATRWRKPAASANTEFGVSVVVPARDTPDLLGPTLEAAEAARRRLDEPSELVVVLSGTAGRGDWPRRFPGVRWVHSVAPLDFVAAVTEGLRHTRHPWVYLLNSDMQLEPGALAALLPLRRGDTFAVGSRIRMEDASLRETNWTDLRLPAGGAVELVERDPSALGGPRGCLYVGGGSGLFRHARLQKMIGRSRAYAPFYWEDVEWGALAWRSGYQCLFCPGSEAVHRHRQTIGRFYSAKEVDRVFERNRLLFHLRNLPGIAPLEQRLLALDEVTWREMFQPGNVQRLAWSRALAYMAPHGEEVLWDRWKLSPAV
jgi:MoaA/NifB/PqqE/SkfB family radical SAM enzyme/GT2 family glycosyltransferase